MLHHREKPEEYLRMDTARHRSTGNSHRLGQRRRYAGLGQGRRDQGRFPQRSRQQVASKFTAGAGPPSRISAGLDPKLAQPSIAAGTVPYFLFSVFYDAGQNRIGLKPR
jgi:hypothetical protein